jgi:tetratricopeptide (TPR) repeat protein
MRPKVKQSTRLTSGLALCSILLFSVSSLQAQGVSSPPRAGVRHANAIPGLDPLSTIQSEAVAPPRIQPLAETISIHELLLPGGAVKEFHRSEKALRSGDFRSAAEHLQRAIQIAPNFVQAHNNLGASYIQLKEYESAVTEFQAAIALDAKIQEAYRNLGLGLFLLRRYPEAEVAARQALQFDPQRSPARYTLGRILAAEGSSTTEAEHLLRESIAQNPDARLPLAQVLFNRGASREAVAELTAYLKSPGANPDKKQAVQSWINRITQAAGPTTNQTSQPTS